MTKGKRKYTVKNGCLLLNGVNFIEGGYNFTVEAPEKAEVSLLLYRRNSPRVCEEIPMSDQYRHGRIRSVRLEGLSAEEYEYNYRIDGEVIADPRARVFHGRAKFGAPWSDSQKAFCCGLLKPDTFDWEGEVSPGLGYEDMILYKLNVRAFTRQMSAVPADKRGTFAGLKEMIPYFKELGINALELMPCYEFEEVPRGKKAEGMVSVKAKVDRVNLWGYIPGYYFAPKRSFSASDSPEIEFRELIKALHREGIECFPEFYFPRGTNVVYALSALHFWKLFYHVDGFHVHGEGFPLDMVLQDGLLSETKMLIEDYDFGMLHQGRTGKLRSVAGFNGGFREDMRRLLKSDEDMVGKAIAHMRMNAGDHAVINAITSQDGFTLMDLVSYNYRHNEDNGENNQDGSSYNYSWNCGVEGPSRKAAIRQIREKQVKNAFLLMLLSQGVPMIYQGDEFGNSQNGNNNAWCQDNPVGWTDWKAMKKNGALFDFVKKAIRFRKAHPILHMRSEMKGTDYKAKGTPDISLHGERAWYVSYENTSRMFGIMYNESYGVLNEDKENPTDKEYLYIACNFHWENRTFGLPNLPVGVKWKKVIDTARAESFLEGETAFTTKAVEASPRSILVLLGREEKK